MPLTLEPWDESGFVLEKEHEIEYPIGTMMVANLWRHDLTQRKRSAN